MLIRARAAMAPAHVVRRWRRREAGMGEVAAMLWLLPVLFAIIFMLIEIGVNLRYRSAVENVVQDTVRAISQDGGTKWASTMAGTAQMALSNGWQTYGENRLIALCYPGQVNPGGAGSWNAATAVKYDTKPTLVCTITPDSSAYPANTVAQYAGSTVTCRGVFDYKPVVPFTSQNRTFNLGFVTAWDTPFSTTIQGATTVGAGE